MASLLLNRQVRLEVLISCGIYALKQYRPVKKYDESGKATNIIDGYAYEVVNVKTFDLITVKVPGAVPSEIVNAGKSDETILVEFENAVLKQYYSKTMGTYCDSIKADRIHIVDPNTISLF